MHNEYGRKILLKWLVIQEKNEKSRDTKKLYHCSNLWSWRGYFNK